MIVAENDVQPKFGLFACEEMSILVNDTTADRVFVYEPKLGIH